MFITVGSYGWYYASTLPIPYQTNTSTARSYFEKFTKLNPDSVGEISIESTKETKDRAYFMKIMNISPAQVDEVVNNFEFSLFHKPVAAISRPNGWPGFLIKRDSIKDDGLDYSFQSYKTTLASGDNIRLLYNPSTKLAYLIQYRL